MHCRRLTFQVAHFRMTHLSGASMEFTSLVRFQETQRLERGRSVCRLAKYGILNYFFNLPNLIYIYY